MGKSYWSACWESNPRGYTYGKPRGLARCRPRGLAAAPPLASPVGPPVRGTVVPRPTACVPSPDTVSAHVCAAEVADATGENLTSKTAAGVVGGVGWPWRRFLGRTVAWGGMAQMAVLRTRPCPPSPSTL